MSRSSSVQCATHTYLLFLSRVLLAGVWNNGLCPCHRCLIGKDDLSKLGAPTDVERTESLRDESKLVALVSAAQEEILLNGYAIDSNSKVEVHLKPQSLVPTTVCLPFSLLRHSTNLDFQNAFSNFSGHPFDIRKALVADIMHEFEIGAWKRVFIHRIRLLEVFSDIKTTLTAELDWRYGCNAPLSSIQTYWCSYLGTGKLPPLDEMVSASSVSTHQT